MSLFSQSLCFGENTLQELEKGADLQPVKVVTPNRSSVANNSDTDIIEESPTACSFRERTKAKHSNKTRKKEKSRSCEQLTTSKVASDCSKNTLSQFFRSEYDFSDDILKILPDNACNISTNNNKFESGKAADKSVQQIEPGYESDMFGDWAVPQTICPSRPTSEINGNDQQDNSVNIWEDSYDFNDIDLSSCEGNENAAKELNLKVDDEIALGLDNVTFTQNFMNEASFENDLNLKTGSNCFAASKFIEEEMENCKKSFTDVMREECQQLSVSSRCSQMNSTFKFNISESSFTLNYSNSTVDNDEKPAMSQNIRRKSNSQLLQHQNGIDQWDLPASIVREYHRKNIFNMFDWQRECLSNSKVLFENSNLVYCAPTSAGKTLVSEILMIKNVLEKQKKVLIILPFVSVVREKMNYLQDLLTSTGIQVEGFFGGYSPRNFDNVHVAVCTIEKANSIVNRLLEQNKIDSIGCIVVDEVHLISDPSRGYILELLLAKILFVNQKLRCNIQVIAMSATLPNLDLLTNWLRAEFYHTDYRPVELKEMIKINDKIFDNKMTLLRSVSVQDYQQFPKDPDNIGQMCVETILEGGSIIVFCPSKDWCESLSKHLANFIYHIGKSKTEMGIKMREQIKQPLIEETKVQLRSCPAGLDSLLEKTLSYGCAYHHAGLTSDERDIVESSFKVGSIRIIMATSTLSSGVNLPARRVIIRSPLFARRTMNALTYRQMIGRAGRTGKDTIGESILICDSSNKKSGEDLIVASLTPLASCLGMENCVHLKRAILEIIASGMATTKEDLEAFCDCTLLSTEKQINFKCEMLGNEFQSTIRTGSCPPQEQNQDDASDPIGTCMRFLLQNEFIRLQMNDNTNEINFISTRLGNACLASSMAPKDGFLLFSELQKARQSFVVETDLHAIYLVTPISLCYQIQDIEWMFYLDLWLKLPASMRRVGDLVGVRDAFFVKAMRGHKLDFKELQIHRRFYVALALEELVSEKNVNDVALKFKCPRGLLQTLQQTASTFAGAVTAFCNALNWTMLAKIITEFKERLFFGVHHDLIDLMKIPNLNSQRARSFFNEGIQNLSDLANSDSFTVEKILYNSICFESKQREGENEWDADQRNKLRDLFVTGKSGLTIREAAEEIIKNARQYLELEMGVENIVWSKKSQSQNSQGTILSKEITAPMNLEATDSSQQSSNVPCTQNDRKRKHDGESSSIGQRFGKKLRTISESESDSELMTDQFTCVRINSLASNTDTDDQSDLIQELIQYKEFHIVHVFRKLEFFKTFEKTIRNSSVVSVSVGVNQLLKAAPVIGLSSLKKQSNSENENLKSYNCAFDDNKFIAGISLCLSDDEVCYLNLQNESEDDIAITFDMKVKFLVDLFHMEHMTLVMYDAKEQCKVLVKCFPQLSTFCARLRDPLVANWLLLPDVDRNLLTMVRKYAPNCGDITECAGIDKWNRRSVSLNCKSPVSPMIRSTAESYSTFQVMRSQMKHLNRCDSIAAAFNDIEMPIQRVLLAMELAGFPVNERRISEVALELTDALKNLENLMFKIHGRHFNIKLKEQVAKVLGLKPGSNGRISLSKQVLCKIDHPIAKLIMQHNSVNATLTGSIQPLIREIVNERIYPRSSCFSSTGRISLYEPNLQSVTNDFEVASVSGQKSISCRRVFQARPGSELISADFCQLELRILTHFSNDKTLAKIMRSNCDVFKMIAARWNNISETEVTDKQRKDAKQICYGIVYGMGVKALAEEMNCDETEAQKQQALFHKCYPGIRVFTEKVLSRARERGFVETISGRRRYLPFITSSDSAKRSKAERQALNTTIQGSAADIAKKAMLEMDKCLRDRANTMKNVKLVLHIHDELVYEAPKYLVKEVVRKLKSSMENCHKSLDVPLRVKVKIGDDWGTMRVFDC